MKFQTKEISVEVFKTNVTDMEDSMRIIKALNSLFPKSEINFDLDDCDKILRIEGDDFCPDQIVIVLKKYGYECAILE